MRSKPYLSNVGYHSASLEPPKTDPKRDNEYADAISRARNVNSEFDDPDLVACNLVSDSNEYLADPPLDFEDQERVPAQPDQEVSVSSDYRTTQPTPSPGCQDQYSARYDTWSSSFHKRGRMSPSSVRHSLYPIPLTIAVHAGSEKYLTLPPSDRHSEGYRIRIIGEAASRFRSTPPSPGGEGEENASNSPQQYSDVVAYYLQDPCNRCLTKARARGIAATGEIKTKKKASKKAVRYQLNETCDVITFCIFIFGCYCFFKLLLD